MTSMTSMSSTSTPKPARWSLRLAGATWLVAIVGVFCSSACSVNSSQISDLSLPDRDQFTKSVSPFMEQRCGALDCHGQIGRPLRLYSVNGLRMQDSPMDKTMRDTRATTPDELVANYFSVVGLEPEEISTSNQTMGAYDDFLLLKKPLDIEGGGVRHKGGPVLRASDPGFGCLTSWIGGQVDAAKCTAALLP
jgi:hypothetical protein